MDLNLERRQIKWLGFLAIVGAFFSVLADLLSGWSATPQAMQTAMSIDIESVRELLLHKPRWMFILGAYLALAFLPLHMFGFVLIYQALRPVGRIWSLMFLVGSFYFVAVGTGYHASYAFLADTIQSGDDALLTRMLDYWYPWGVALVAGYVALCLYLIALIMTGRTMYRKTTIAASPLPILMICAVIIALLPASFSGLKVALAVTGLNLPLLIFYVVTVETLLGSGD